MTYRMSAPDLTNSRAEEARVSVAVLIPAYQPTAAVVDLVKRLHDLDRDRIVTRCVVVNDGSSPEYEQLFEQLAAMPHVTVLRHAVNLGKGAALKTGFNHVLTIVPNARGVVTADADGQHAPENVMAVARELSRDPSRVVLGAREFDPNTPLRSAFGNKLTRVIYRFFTGKRLRDTQTGLRGWPLDLCRRCLRIVINGYDYELEALIISGREFEITEVPIKTIYIEGNKSSHFNPIWDSLRIYYVFLRFCGASLLTAVLDNTIFFLTLPFTHSIGWSQALGRGGAMVVNFGLARQAVFHSHENPRVSFLKFVLLVVINGFVSYGMIRLMTNDWGFSLVGAKLLAEGLLFVANFAIQRELIFTSPGPERGI
jgi:glycosyltransferase involved in cell wall biosynthesis